MSWKLPITLLLFPLTVSAQGLESLEDFQLKYGRYQLNQYLKKPTSNGLPGTALLPFTPKPSDPLECNETTPGKKTHYEILLIADGNTQDGIKLEDNQEHYADRVKPYYEGMPDPAANSLTPQSVVSEAREAYRKYMEKNPGINPGNSNVPELDLQSEIGRSLITESLLRASSVSTMNEKEIAAGWANVIGSISSDRKERLSLLATIGDRLYANYNEARNPKSNNKSNNPDGKEIPKGDLTLQQIFGAALAGNEFGGGVCNDISETLAYAGKTLFPDEDVLTITGGSHFGVIVTDGKETTLIDGSTRRVYSGGFKLHNRSSAANMRISKVENGQLKEIAVVDAELGQLVEATFQSDKPLLTTSKDINKVIAQIKKVIDINENKRRELSLATGASKLSDSQVVMVVAKYETFSKNGKFTIGAGGSRQQFDSGGSAHFNIHFKTGYERTLFRYKSDQVKLNFVSGVHADGTISPTQGNLSGIAGSLELRNKLNVNYQAKNPNGVSAQGQVGVIHSFGPTSWGETTGAVSTKIDVGQLLKNTTFHLNQVNANVALTKPMNTNMTAGLNMNYQGSNIGQRLSILGNVEVTAPNGVEILVFGGIEKNDLKGYQTKNGLLAGPSGGTMGVNLQKNNVKLNTSIRGIGTDPTVNAGVNILFKTKSKTKRKPRGF